MTTLTLQSTFYHLLFMFIANCSLLIVDGSLLIADGSLLIVDC